MKMLLLNVTNETVTVVDAETLDDFYKLLGCDCIDIVNRRVGKMSFDIICDDEGLFVNDPKISAIGNMGEVVLVGNLLLCKGTDKNGDLLPLEDEDIAYLKRYIVKLCTHHFPKGYPMLTQVS